MNIDWRALRLPLPPPGVKILRKLAQQSKLRCRVSLGLWGKPRELTANEWKGFVPGTYGLLDALVPFFLAAVSLNYRKHKVVGLEYVHRFVRAVEKEGKRGTILPDHKGFADIFAVQTMFALKGGYWKIATRKLLPLLGLLYYSRYPIESLMMRASNVVIALPPTLQQDGVPRSSRGMFVRILRAMYADYPRKLAEGHIGLIFAEGTRSRTAAMLVAQAGVTKLLDHPNAVYLLVALEGTEKILPPADRHGIPLPLFGTPLTVIFGIRTQEEVSVRSTQLSEQFEVSYEQAFIDVLYGEGIAQLHKDHGDAKYAGYYGVALEEIYAPRKKEVIIGGG